MNSDAAGTDRLGSLALLATALESMLNDSSMWDADAITQLRSGLHSDGVDVLASVAHFLSDSDIRTTDADYRDFQEARMRELIAALRRGAPRDELLNVSFLR